MKNNFLLWNPATFKFYNYSGTFYGSSKQSVDKAVEYINRLQAENRRLKELLKLSRVSDLGQYDLEQLNELMVE